MLPRKSMRVCIFIAPREYLPSAQVNKLILTDIVVESKANISLSRSRLGIGQSAYKGRTSCIK